MLNDLCADIGRGQKRGRVGRTMSNAAAQYGQTDESDTPDIGGRTIADICEAWGLDPESVRQAWGRAKKKGKVCRDFSRTLVPTSAEMSAVSCLAKLGGRASGSAAAEASEGVDKPVVAAPAAVEVPMPDSLFESLGIAAAGRALSPKKQPETAAGTPAQDGVEGANWPMWAIMCASTLVTLQSVSNVTGSLFQGNEEASLTLTGVLCAVPLVLSWQKKVSWEAKFLVFGLIIFEGFCNTTRIYAGLLNFVGDASSNAVANQPTLFLQMVMGMLSTEKTETALGLSITIAAIIAAIFGMAFRAINKKK